MRVHDAHMRTALCVVAMGLWIGVSTSGAAPAPPTSGVCGDGHREGSEKCDGNDLGGETCASLTGGFGAGGTLTCNPDCTFNADDCKRALLESLVVAKGSTANRCQLEWTAQGTATKGAPTNRICSDGDGTCDQDHDFNSKCTMELEVCLNVPDPKAAGCTFATQPGRVFRVQVMQPRAGANQAALQAILGAFKQLGQGAGVATNVSSDSVSFSPPITDFECGAGTIVVPLKGQTGHAKPGKLRLRVRSSDNSGKLRATGNLTLSCMP
jgi:hypothetical protein